MDDETESDQVLESSSSWLGWHWDAELVHAPMQCLGSYFNNRPPPATICNTVSSASLPCLMVTGSWDWSLEVWNHRWAHAVPWLCPRYFFLPEGLAHRRASLHGNTMRWHAMRRSTMDVNHSYLSHPMRGWRRCLRTQSRQLAVSGLLPVQRGVIYSVCRARSTIRTRGADGGTVKSPHGMLWTIKTRAGVWSMCCSNAHSSLLEEVWICVQALIPSRKSVALSSHILIWLDISSL